jgi:hypothetical protein
MFRKMGLAAAAVAMVTAPVQAACWKTDEVAAAGVRELQSMLMVAALRCQVAGHPMMEDYNAFVQSNRSAIGLLNDKIKAHFIHSLGPVAGQRAYDAFTTSMANGYGGAASGAEACSSADGLAREGAMLANSAEGLMLLAEREGLAAKLPEGLCAGAVPVVVAAAGAIGETVRR